MTHRPCPPWLVAAVILITEAGVVLSHVWAREGRGDGKIEFLGDCWHELKGQTVDLPECEW